MHKLAHELGENLKWPTESQTWERISQGACPWIGVYITRKAWVGQRTENHQRMANTGGTWDFIPNSARRI